MPTTCLAVTRMRMKHAACMLTAVTAAVTQVVVAVTNMDGAEFEESVFKAACDEVTKAMKRAGFKEEVASKVGSRV